MIITDTKNPNAFPALAIMHNETYEKIFSSSDGMMLRDYFAARASEEDIQNHIKVAGVFDSREGLREAAKYSYADSMLKARVQS